MKRLLFVARRPPWPLTNGGRIRSHRLLESLSAAFETTLLVLQHEPDSPDGAVDLSELAHALPGVDIVSVPGLGAGKRSMQLTGLVSPRSWHYGRYALGRLGDEVERLAGERSIDLIHADDLGTALVLPKAAGQADRPIRVYSSHNVEYRIVGGDRRSGTSWVRRAFAAVEAVKVKREEHQVWSTVDLTLACSEFDAAIIAAEGNGQVALCPNGADPAPARVLPAPGGSAGADQPLRLLFVGSAAYSPYERGLAWMVREVFPLLRGRVDFVFDVVGQPPAEPVAAQEIRYQGYVDSVDPWYEQADAVVVPVFEGSGTRLKLVEAAVQRRPIVTTALGAQGLPLEPDRHYRRAETPTGFAEAILDLVDGHERSTTMVDAAAVAVEPLLWPTIGADLVARYQRLLGPDPDRDHPDGDDLAP
jgi:hypothetical protein